MPTFS